MSDKSTTPMMKQYFEIKNKYKDYILFYRLGDFYEMFYDDAILASKELEITLTKRNSGNDTKAPLCGIPYHSAENYLQKLLQKGYKVAICEQIEDPSTAKGIVKRDVVRILTPGTVTEPQMLADDENNFLISIYQDDFIYYAISDISTFEIRHSKFNLDQMELLLDNIQMYNPKEIIFNQRTSEIIKKKILTLGYNVNSFEFNINDSDTPAVKMMFEYLRITQKSDKAQLFSIYDSNDDDKMILDKNTIMNLELFQTIRNFEKKGSLFDTINETKTSMGARNLKKWLIAPLKNKQEILKRQNIVEKLISDRESIDELEKLLKEIYDLERLTSKLIFSNPNPKDFIAIKSTLELIPNIISLLKKLDLELFNDLILLLNPLFELKSSIESTIVEDPPFLLKDGGYINSNYNEETKELDNILNHSMDIVLSIESREKEKTGIKNLRINYNKVFGYYIEITNSNKENVPNDYIRKQTLSNAERYITPELKELEEKIIGAKDKLIKLEANIFSELIAYSRQFNKELMNNSKAIGEIDTYVSFAMSSLKNNYVKPIIDNDGIVEIIEGRHPVIENLISEPFISNNTYLDNYNNQFHIITGPNMAGKSTYLRQIALIVLLSQIGMYVPALRAKLSIVDRIFTRVGASDNLSKGLSTFMVEMSELSFILKNATKDSIIVLDEIGRGTSTYDGLSIAWSLVEFLTNGDITPKTLFATHYHELTELEQQSERIKNFNITVKEQEDDIVFLRKIKNGGANQSFGIQVAKLAGLPNELISNAKKILSELEKNDINNARKIEEPEQISFFYENNSIIEKIKNIDLDTLRPIDAINLLYELKGKINE
jgi:DNA mismatch repair protein MutS